MLLVASETGHVYTFATRKLQPMITSDAGKALIQTCLNSPDPTGLINGNGGSGNNSGTTGPDVVTTNGHVSSLLGSSSSSSPSSNGVGPSSSSSSSMNNNHLSQNGDNHSELARLVMANGTGRGSISGCSTPNTVVDQRMSATGFEETDLSYSVSGEDCSPLNDKVRSSFLLFSSSFSYFIAISAFIDHIIYHDYFNILLLIFILHCFRFGDTISFFYIFHFSFFSEPFWYFFIII